VSVRAKLTVAYLLVLALILVLFAAGVYAFVAAEERANVDRILHERIEALASDYSDEGNLREVVRQIEPDDDVFAYDAKGNLLFASPHHLRSAPLKPSAGYFTIGSTRCIAAKVGPYLVVTTESLAGRRHALTRLFDAFAVVIPLALIIAAFGGYFLAGRSLRPLNAALQALERSVQQQKQLLADTSHELRTPAAIIRSEAEVTLSRERGGEEYRRAIDAIRSESVHLSNLLDGVLLLARADAQQTPIDKRDVQLSSIINDAVQSMQTLAHSRGITLTCASNGGMPIRGNAELLRRMLLNLLSNAISFTDNRVELAAHRDGASYVITVSDNGRGIPSDAQAKIFDRFFRADEARTRDLDGGGAGLGLPIARWIARAHGGDVRLVQSSSSGSVFEAVLPFSESGAS